MEPKIVKKEAFKVVGLEVKTNMKTCKADIPELWGKFMPRMEEIKNRINPEVCYGVCESIPGFELKNFSEETDFIELVCVEAGVSGDIPEGMVERTIPAQKYAVFTHRGPITKIHETYDYIYHKWLPSSEYEWAGTDDFEYYDSRFKCGQEGSEFDIYIPVK